MKTFEVCFKYETWANYTVDAQDQVEAENIAHEMLKRDEGDYLHNGEWTDTTIEEITPPPPPMTDDQLAFIEAYLSAVADSPKECVIDFLFDKPVDNEYYTSIADAYGMWCFAIKFQKAQKI